MSCEDLDLDELEQLMQEPPGGVNYGRTRGGIGYSPLGSVGWMRLDEDLETLALDLGLTISGVPERPRHRPNKPFDTIRHGTRAAYNHDGCRCTECRAANREHSRRRRKHLADKSDL